jgi:HAD superfamily hydrolase (TIGR01490 family)
MEAAVTFWDMDHTVVNNDCDVSWKTFLVERGLAPAEDTRQQAEMFYAQYERGELDVEAFLTFQLREFRGRTVAEMRELADAHFQSHVRDRIYSDAVRRIEALRAAGAQQCMLTATNRIIAEPVARHLGFTDLLATELELADRRFTGHITGEYCVGAGKLSYVDDYCHEHGCGRAAVAYFGDSTSDIPILAEVGFPRAVNPGSRLRQAAEDRGWPILTFQ